MRSRIALLPRFPGPGSGLAALCTVMVACGSSGGEPSTSEVSGEDRGVEVSATRPAATEGWPAASDSIEGTPWTRQDWEIFQATLHTARGKGLDTLPLGEAIAEMGRLFLGAPYVPRTLEVPGPERLVVNFRGLDCVTFVENVLALTRFSRVHGLEALDDPVRARELYETDLAALRYREGAPAGYASRLHYFSDWLAVNEAAGRIALETRNLGGVPDSEVIDFMSTHAEAYEQLADPAIVDEVRRIEAGLQARGPRYALPEDAVGKAAGGIRTGDVIAATSTVKGLDVAHTGIAVRVDGTLHLLHAPLVGSTVVLSERPLAERIVAIETQDGIMVARPGGTWFGEER
ncbi:MAG: DUF1460 domain-containing protein [Gemmatimonadota bacterium]